MKNHFISVREGRFTEFLEKLSKLNGKSWEKWSKEQSEKRKLKRKLQFDERGEEVTFTFIEQINVESFNVISDTSVAALNKREKAYILICDAFGVLLKIEKKK